MDAHFLGRALGHLAAERPVFHSEADFQHALALTLRQLVPAARTRLETRLQPGVREALDLLVIEADQRTGLELKYLVRRIDYEGQGERFVLRSRSAHDQRRYDVCKDIARLERYVKAGLIDQGFVVVLCNDAAFWNEGRADTIDTAFRIHEGRLLHGTLTWDEAAGQGTTRMRASALELSGRYPVAWTDYAEVPGPHGRFRTLVIGVPGS